MKRKADRVFTLPIVVSLSLMLILSLLTGCYKEVAPDVEETAAGGAQFAMETVDIQATAIMNSTLAAQPAAETPQVVETLPSPTPLPPSPTPTELIITAAPTFTPVPTAGQVQVEVAATPSPPPGEVKHVVQPGENLFRIALRYNTTFQDVAKANGITNPDRIYVGQVLVIPVSGTPAPAPTGGTTYVVQPGDNLFRIALRYNMSYLYLARYNNISDPSRIYVGQVLRIP
ncbi:MAG: LysM peptidoglycan-binding domain-containing protein [Anaerolineae bacterium]|nr:LysM peptidoglycan-binding domain-containing protein [Anaerolineae bacterium]